MTRIRHVGGNITITTKGKDISYAKDNIEFHSNKKISFNGGENGISFGDPESPPKRVHPNVVEVQFLDEKEKVLHQESIAKFGGIKASDILFGKKIKIKILTKELTDGTKISFKLKGETKSKHQEFFSIDKLKWEKEITNNYCETELFELNPLWNSEDFEKYNYTSHKTEIESDDLNDFYVEGVLNARPFELPEKENRLKPISYLRNYEELIGLYNVNKENNKDLFDNYENKFISSNAEILEIVKEFSEFINFQKDLTIDQISKRVETDAKCLWDAATKQIQSGNLDDRALYWARNKMQVRLKRHPLFEKDIDFKKSTVNAKSELSKIITLFEEKSRNYNGIDFSKANGKKKLLLSGYDPFVLNPFKSGNVLQSNPSGVTAFSLHGKTIGNYFIQTFIFPVRYADFDSFNGGKGVVETFFQPHIQNVDMIITASQGSPFRFDVDRFPCKNRGGFADNMFWGNASDGYNEENFKQLTDGMEFYETTLPYDKIVPNKNAPNDTFWIYLNQTFNEFHGGESDITKEGIVLKNKLTDIQKMKSYEGSGGDYLSNEIFYRVAKLRTEQKPELKTGHLHLPKIQEKNPQSYERGNQTTEDINTKIAELISNVQKIISK